MLHLRPFASPSSALAAVLALGGFAASCSSGAGDVPRALRDPLAPLAFDSTRGVTVLFGSLDGSRSNETWEWDGTSWTLRATSGPSARQGHALAFDSEHGVTVLFGGLDETGALPSETWEWNGSAWTLRTSAGPTGRSGHALAYDITRGTVFLFGGNAGTPQQDTWEYDGTPGRWTFRSSSGPAPRTRPAMAFDSARNVTVLFGGQDISRADGAFSRDTWHWNAQTRRWTEIVVSGPTPSARYLHAMAFDSTRGVTLLFGGFGARAGAAGGEFTGDTWAWDGVAWSQVATTDPSPRASHALAFDSTRNVAVLFGGYDGSFNRETWEWDGTQWAEREAAFNTPRLPQLGLRGFVLVEGAGTVRPYAFELRADGAGMHESWNGSR